MRPWTGLQLLLLLVALTLVVAVAVHAGTTVWPSQVRDLHSYWHAANLLRSGGTGLYDANRLPPGVWPFLYPPAFAALFAPLLSVPEAAGYVVWSLVVASSVVVSFWGIQRLGDLGPGALLLIGLALGFPTFQLILMGQVDGLVVAFLALALLAERQSRPCLSGFLIGLAAVIKVIPALAILPFLVLRRWRTVAAAGISGFLFSCLPLLWLVPDVGLGTGVTRWMGMHNDFVSEVVVRGLGKDVTNSWMSLPWNASLPGAALRVFDEPWVGVGAMWLLVGAGTVVAHRIRSPAVGVSLVVTGAALGNFVFWSHNVFLFALTLGLAYSASAALGVLASFSLATWVSPVLGAIGYLVVWLRCAATAVDKRG